MFGSLFRKAQATVDNAIGQLVRTVLIALPFVVAMGFATAAATSWLVKEYGLENGLLALAGVYAILGTVVWGAIGDTSAVATESGPPTTDEAATPAAEGVDAASMISDTDRELLMATLTSAAPAAFPIVARNLVKNLPLVLLLLIVAYVLAEMSRSGTQGTEGTGTDSV